MSAARTTGTAPTNDANDCANRWPSSRTGSLSSRGTITMLVAGVALNPY